MSEDMQITVSAETTQAQTSLTELAQRVDQCLQAIANLGQALNGLDEQKPVSPLSLEQTESAFLKQLQTLETYKNLGLDVTKQVQETWTAHLENLKNNYAEDVLAYNRAQELKKQADAIAFRQAQKNIVEHSRLSTAAYNSVQAGAMAMFNDIGRLETNSNNTLVKGFTAMANSFIYEVERMIAQWLAFQAIKSALTPLGLGFLVTPSAGARGAFLNTEDINGREGSMSLARIGSKLDDLINCIKEEKTPQVNVYLRPDDILRKGNAVIFAEKTELGQTYRTRV